MLRTGEDELLSRFLPVAYLVPTASIPRRVWTSFQERRIGEPWVHLMVKQLPSMPKAWAPVPSPAKKVIIKGI